MLTEICAYLHNYFTPKDGIFLGEFKIEGGSIEPLDFLQLGQYFRIVNSTFNDGVYKYPTSELTDETFEGAVWAMSVPPSLVALADKIKTEEEEKQKTIADGGWDVFQSQSFGGYSGTVKADVSWETKYKAQLKKWRKL